ncbi:hypothetical protein [Streptomyces camelliae]|uniref:Uncharacterized protein n=1 Tax=Streptomyces camelliae TaxID=3004093 RepID=A0ABY7NT84_9ACTN|nr:hypothetical protein [Streptomyces sp. HUAS 2-6]WBO61446.1 hypothetical protein O1G22_00375 [Streptomyces sp. HUAS 2-6]
MVEFRMPEFHAPFPMECNPHLAEASQAMREWAELMGLVPTERARARLRATGADLSGAHVWPRASLSLLTLGCRWLALCFRIDDQLDEDDQGDRPEACAAVIAELHRVLDGGVAQDEKGSSVVLRALSALWQETSVRTPQHWWLVSIQQTSPRLSVLIAIMGI